MNKNKRQVEASKVGVTPTDKAQTTGLTILKASINIPGKESNSEVIEEPKKKGLNLDETMKLVEDLHMKKRYRDRLESSIELLGAFEVKQKNEELDDHSYYTGCKISIKDDAGNEFVTKNPTIIGDIVNHLMQKFNEKRTEIEASIVLPL